VTILIDRPYLILSIFFHVLLVYILSGNALPDDQSSIIINGMRERYAHAAGWKAEYTREAISKTMAMLETGERHDLAEGQIFFKQPHFIRLEQAIPQEELLLTNGDILWWYIPGRNIAYKYPAQDFGRELRLLSDVFQGLKDIANTFQITITTTPETGTYHLILRPKPLWQEIDHLELIVFKRDFAIKQIDIYNNIGGVTKFVFRRWEERSCKKESFSFSPPSDVRVVEK
jgi:outer membrane lipoprotein-sorting protein